jgi:hypothetical protein
MASLFQFMRDVVEEMCLCTLTNMLKTPRGAAGYSSCKLTLTDVAKMKSTLWPIGTRR